jgi:hypothetical protein
MHFGRLDTYLAQGEFPLSPAERLPALSHPEFLGIQSPQQPCERSDPVRNGHASWRSIAVRADLNHVLADHHLEQGPVDGTKIGPV